MTYVNAAGAVRVTIFSIGGKFWLVPLLQSYTLLLKLPVLDLGMSLKWPLGKIRQASTSTFEGRLKWSTHDRTTLAYLQTAGSRTETTLQKRP